MDCPCERALSVADHFTVYVQYILGSHIGSVNILDLLPVVSLQIYKTRGVVY